MGDPSSMKSHTTSVSKSTIIDLTHSLISGGVPACPGHPSYAAHCISHISKGECSNVHSLTLGSHTGTHLDAPFHFFDDGTTVDQLDLSLLTAAPAVVVDLRHKKLRERITWDDIGEHEARMGPGVAVLFCTGWSRDWGKPNYRHHPFLDPDAARRVMGTGVKVIGVDTMSPDEVTDEGDSGCVHRIVLGSGGIIVENLNGLENILEKLNGEITVSMLPLRLEKCDGSPIRAVAWSAGGTI